MNTVLTSLLHLFDQKEITYCLLRGDGQSNAPDFPPQTDNSTTTEIDLLVAENRLTDVQSLLAQLGFVALPGWGHAPHHFYVAYDQQQDGWLKLDVVTEASYGRPTRALRTNLAVGCLQTRRRLGAGFAPAPEYELAMLLLHCLLDKGYFKPEHQARLQSLLEQVSDDKLLVQLFTQTGIGLRSKAELADIVRRGAWNSLLARQAQLITHLTGSDAMGVRMRQFKGRILRKLNAAINFRRPRAVSVAVLAPDGAGKSTVTEGLAHTFYFPVRTIYMGLYQKQSAGKRSLLGRMGLAGRILRQWLRYGGALRHLAQRRLVIFDRYTYDALLTADGDAGWRKQGRRWLLANCCPAPDLVILLDAPGELLFARKGEHTAELLETQRQQYLGLRNRIPNMTVVDATQDSEQVRRTVTALIWRSYLRRQHGRDVTVINAPAVNSESVLAN
ncbi:MAG: hypothetical protein KDE54_01225 [Caldilineaceae bacterium]|nr:hypothetical protein [Caldilineaceae bacterium]